MHTQHTQPGLNPTRTFDLRLSQRCSNLPSRSRQARHPGQGVPAGGSRTISAPRCSARPLLQPLQDLFTLPRQSLLVLPLRSRPAYGAQPDGAGLRAHRHLRTGRARQGQRRQGAVWQGCSSLGKVLPSSPLL